MQAVKEFSLDIEDGEFIVLVGPSGCGKSTALRMIAGLEGISSGKILIDGTAVNDMAAKDRDIAMVFQNYALYPHMTVYENMAFGLKMRKMSKAEIDSKVRAAAEILNLDALLERKPKALSGGERQRAAMGRAMVRRPKLFLMDEPLSNLDAKLRVQMREEIAQLHGRLGTTVIYVTHDQVEAMTLGSRIVVMKDGQIQQADTPENLYWCPANQFVASFIGSPQMNFFNGVVTSSGIQIGGQQIPMTGHRNLGAHLGQQVIVGIRPEDILIGEPQFQCHVERVEYLGAEVYLYVNLEGMSLLIRTSPQLADSRTISFSFAKEKIHLFEKNTGHPLIVNS